MPLIVDKAQTYRFSAMARMLPPHFPYPDDPQRQAEATVFDQFSKLQDKWTIIYSLSWHGERSGRTGDGEADFVLLHPQYGFFVAEVKGGERVFIENGQWYTKPHGRQQSEKIRDPFEQALSASKTIDRWLSENWQGPKLSPLGHFVVFPGHIQIGDISPAGRRDIIVDRKDLSNLLPTLQRISKHWSRTQNLTSKQMDEIVAALRPSIAFELDTRIAVEHAQRGMKELTQQQLTILAAIRRQKRLVVNGSAGTGKTILATESARFHAESGMKTLFLCFNRPLGEKLQKHLSGTRNLTVGSFHSFAKNQVDIASLTYDEFEDIPYLLGEAASLNKTSFDAVIIDEAQDFKADWWEALLELCRDPANTIFHVFRDVNQDVYEGESTPFLESFSSADLSLNCRNTIQIAERVHALGRLSTTPQSQDGPSPVFQVVSARSGVERRLTETISTWMRTTGLSLDEITVLTDTAELADTWFGSSVGEFKLGDGTKETIRVETIQRFKGLESEAVLCVFDTDRAYADDDRDLERLGYVGLSRAKVLLSVLANEKTLKRLQA